MNRIRECRQNKKLTLVQLSEELAEKQNFKITADALGKYERGKREPKLETWQKLADFFEVPIPYLQGLGISRKEAVDLVWNWINDKEGFYNFDISQDLKNFFHKNYSQEELDKILTDKQFFSNILSKKLKSVFSYYSLASIHSPEDLETRLAMKIGTPYESVIAQIYNIDFKNDSNEQIQMALEGIITDIFMYIDKK
ncbi:helix-turn-helix transcriptional regulator [Lactobacillus intestinalis]|uniref:helix-turn-helix domain-containing protein n=1 Tax=Lactobacillus intestinalis TaxID=151781 RepID=UPI0026EF4106|nr:helix-turn-helix transcriptional regulator [Lactobacillus intestinalis]